MARKTSIAEMSILLSADPSGVKEGVAEAKREMANYFPRVKSGDMDFARVGAGLDKKFQKADITSKSPFMLSKRAALDESLDDLGKKLKVERAKQKFGSLGASAAHFSNQLGEAAEIAALAAPPVALAGAVIGAATMAVGTMFDLAKKADPEAAKEWDAAWNDLYAVLGESFVGMLKDTTQNLRDFADVIKTVNGAIPGGGGESTMGAWWKVQKAGMGAELPSIVKGVMEFFGMEVADSTGAGGMGAASVGTISEAADALSLAALGADPAQRMADNQGETNSLLTQIRDKLLGSSDANKRGLTGN